MDNTTSLKPRMRLADFFLHLGSFVSLYASVGALLFLLYTVIDVAFPPVNNYGYYGSSTISLEVAILIVFFPIFLFLSWVIQKGYIEDSTRRESTIRKVLIYLTLFVAGISMAGDLVTIIYRFLNGEDFTTGFVLKALSVLVVSAGIFYYYLQDVRNKLTASARLALRVASLVLLVGSVVWGFSVLGSPRTQRLQRVDGQKLSDLQNIQSQVIQYYQSKGTLPETLAAMQDSLSYYSIPKDPQTGKDYEYTKTGGLAFELCASFNLAAPANPSNAYGYKPVGSDNWQYQSGHYCFDRTIDPELYPINNINLKLPAARPI